MKKLTLNLDALVVESFETRAGTVKAYEAETEASNCATCDTCVGDNCPQPA